VITTDNVAEPIGAEITHVSTENVRGSIKDGVIDFVAGSLGKHLSGCWPHRYLVIVYSILVIAFKTKFFDQIPINLNGDQFDRITKFLTVLLIIYFYQYILTFNIG